MTTTKNEMTDTQPTFVQTERGLTLADTGLTLHHLLDHLAAKWPACALELKFGLTERQMADLLAYIEAHRAEVEAGYRLVLPASTGRVGDWRCGKYGLAGEMW
jgi:hypothetical protein